jgi:CubicO group peptidase (beta-lactamase class C family)
MAERELDDILRKHTESETGSLHGATFVAVDHTGQEIYKKSYGFRTLDGPERLTPDALSWLASASKLVSSIAGMQLVDQGLIGLDDDVRPFLPGLREAKVLVGWADGDDDLEAYQFNARGSTVWPFLPAEDADVGQSDGSTRPRGSPLFEEIKDNITLRSVRPLVPSI